MIEGIKDGQQNAGETKTPLSPEVQRAQNLLEMVRTMCGPLKQKEGELRNVVGAYGEEEVDVITTARLHLQARWIGGIGTQLKVTEMVVHYILTGIEDPNLGPAVMRKLYSTEELTTAPEKYPESILPA